MTNQWRIHNGLYYKYAIKAKELVSKFPNIKFNWIPRELNTEADELSKSELIKRNIVIIN
jgi:ribonuclease HI